MLKFYTTNKNSQLLATLGVFSLLAAISNGLANIWGFCRSVVSVFY